MGRSRELRGGRQQLNPKQSNATGKQGSEFESQSLFLGFFWFLRVGCIRRGLGSRWRFLWGSGQGEDFLLELIDHGVAFALIEMNDDSGDQ